MAKERNVLVYLFSKNILQEQSGYNFHDKLCKQKITSLIQAVRMLKEMEPGIDADELFVRLSLLYRAFCGDNNAIKKLQEYNPQLYFKWITEKVNVIIQYLQRDHTSPIYLLFSDIDNTLIHQTGIKKFLQVPGENRTMSKRGISLLAQIGASGVPVILISGRRISSFDRVMKIIPHSFAILEHGCVILNSDGVDDKYASQFFEYVGDHHKPHKYGLLWEYEKQLQEQGYITDSKGRIASFRIDPKENNMNEDNIRRLLAAKHPNGIKTEQNLTFIDFIPPLGGKDKAVQYFLQKWNTTWDHVACLGDDYNDIGMLSKAKYTFTHSGAISQVQQIVRSRGGYVSPYSGHHGTVDLLTKLVGALNDPPPS
ncbi:HAD-IIB family hydrolase [Candidatus Woesearchaeota archaeon]|nr:HAD-IIB family hydrolase [Candidatus Woesearchaeota archaeon]